MVFELEDAGAVFFHLIIAYTFGCFIGQLIPQPTDHPWPMITVNAAQLKVVMLLKTPWDLLWLFSLLVCSVLKCVLFRCQFCIVVSNVPGMLATVWLVLKATSNFCVKWLSGPSWLSFWNLTDDYPNCPSGNIAFQSFSAMNSFFLIFQSILLISKPL